MSVPIKNVKFLKQIVMKTILNKKTILPVLCIIAITVSSFVSPTQDEKWVAPKEADQLVNPLVIDNNAIQKGKKIYNQVCAVCHGTSGKGDGPNAITLKKKPANHTSKEVQMQSDGALYWKISKGRDPMPTYKDIFTKTQKWQLVAYLRTLKENN